MLKVEKIKQEKERFLPLLILGDPDEDHIRSYLPQTDLYVLFSNDMPISVAVVKKEGTIVRIINIASEPNHRGQGHAARLVNYLKDDYARSADALQIEVPKHHEAPFYALGFRLLKDEKTSYLLVKNLKESDE